MKRQYDFVRFRNRLEEKAKDVRARPVLYVALGDSVTQGCMEFGTIEHEQVFHQYVGKFVIERYPNTILNVINAGVSGDTAVQGLERLQRDVLSFAPDLVTIGYGVNDAHAGFDRLDAYLSALDQIVRKIREVTEADILLLTPNMMMKRDHPGIHQGDRRVVPRFLETAERNYLEIYVKALREFMNGNSLPFLDVYSMWEEMEKQGEDIHARLANGINHPDRPFHHQMGKAIARILLGDSIS